MSIERPVLLSLFSNPERAKQDDLQELSNEQVAITDMLASFADKNHLFQHYKGTASLENAYDFIGGYSSRVALFHFGGHHEGGRIFLKDGSTDLKGLLESVVSDNYSKLKLLFVNACETLEDVEAWSSNIPVVILTERKVKDRQAAAFAKHFYKRLIEDGQSIQAAFNSAKSFIESARYEEEEGNEASRGRARLEKTLDFAWELRCSSAYFQDYTLPALLAYERPKLFAPQYLLHRRDLDAAVFRKRWQYLCFRYLPGLTPKTWKYLAAWWKRQQAMDSRNRNERLELARLLCASEKEYLRLLYGFYGVADSNSVENAEGELVADFFKPSEEAADAQLKRFYLVLAEAGAGKTLALKHLFIKTLLEGEYAVQFWHINQFWEVDPIKMQAALPEKEPTLVFIDGLDESNRYLGNTEIFFEKLEKRCQYFDQVVLACREGLFDANARVKTIPLEYSDGHSEPALYRRLVVIKLQEEQIKQQIKYRLSKYSKKQQKKVRSSLEGSSGVLRPFLLPYLSVIAEKILKQTKVKSTWRPSEYDIIGLIINQWLAREEQKDLYPLPIAEKQQILKKLALNALSLELGSPRYARFSKEQLAAELKEELEQLDEKVLRSIRLRSLLEKYSYEDESGIYHHWRFAYRRFKEWMLAEQLFTGELYELEQRDWQAYFRQNTRTYPDVWGFYKDKCLIELKKFPTSSSASAELMVKTAETLSATGPLPDLALFSYALQVKGRLTFEEEPVENLFSLIFDTYAAQDLQNYWQPLALKLWKNRQIYITDEELQAWEKEQYPLHFKRPKADFWCHERNAEGQVQYRFWHPALIEYLALKEGYRPAPGELLRFEHLHHFQFWQFVLKKGKNISAKPAENYSFGQTADWQGFWESHRAKAFGVQEGMVYKDQKSIARLPYFNIPAIKVQPSSFTAYEAIAQSSYWRFEAEEEEQAELLASIFNQPYASNFLTQWQRDKEHLVLIARHYLTQGEPRFDKPLWLDKTPLDFYVKEQPISAAEAKAAWQNKRFISIIKPEEAPLNWSWPTLLNEKEEEDTQLRYSYQPIQLSAYKMAKTAVTVAEFAQFVAETGYLTQAEREGGTTCFYKGTYPYRQGLHWRYRPLQTEGSKMQYRLVSPEEAFSYPVVFISWYDAIAYCNWLNEKHGFAPFYDEKGVLQKGLNERGYRLPTEAEWQYAAAGGLENPVYAGKGDLKDLAWYVENSAKQEAGLKAALRPVAQKEANDFGLYDMSGNQLEWCYDIYQEDIEWPEGVLNPCQLEIAEGQLETRVLRGGAWNYDARDCRVACRYHGNPDGRSFNNGFRLVYFEF